MKRVSLVMKQVQLEGSHLANLHILRCLQDGERVPPLEQMLFYRCYAATLGNIEARDRATTIPKDPSFHTTCLRYWAGRDSESSYTAQRICNAGAMINETARMMGINALNMAAPQFRRRLHQFIRFRYAPKGKIQLKYKEAKRIVDSCYRVKQVHQVDDDGNPTEQFMYAWSEWDATDDPIESKLREWLQIVPWKRQIRQHSAHFIKKLYDMLTWMEAFVEEHPRTKGARLYSLLPVSTSYPAMYVKVNGSSLYGLFARLMDQPRVEEFLRTELNIVPAKKRPSDAQRQFAEKTFQTHRSEIMRAVFDVTPFETKNRKFVDEVKTNGYAISVTVKRPLTTTSVVSIANTAHKKRKKNDGSSAVTSLPKNTKAPDEVAEMDDFSKELLKLGPSYSPDVLIGIDPGMRSLATAVVVVRLRHRRGKRRKRRKRQKQKKQRTHQVRLRARSGNSKQRLIQISGGQYRHMARMNDFRLWYEKLKIREPWYAGVNRAMPSFQTSRYDVYAQRLQFFWMHVRFLLAFCAEQGFLRWRFTQDRAKASALDALAKHLVPSASTNVCVGFGDWSQRDGIKGHASVPVKGFRNALSRRATVLPIDEYRTSVTCSSCHKRLKQARLFTKVKKDDDEIQAKPHLSKKETKERDEMQKFRNPELACTKIVLKCTRNDLRCTNSRCKANFWDRDVNAARNMLELLRSGLKAKVGPHRLKAFRRGQPVQ